MKLLVLGGTKFLGRHLVEAALARGDEVTLFNRGQTNPDIFPEVERLRGERDGGLDALGGRRWDAVVDTSGYVPRVVRASAELLAGAADFYGFTYWTERVARGGEVLAPAPRERQVQFVDARDLAEWILRMADARRAGVFNASGPDYVLTMGSFLEGCREATSSDARFTWVGEQFLLEKGVQPWAELPLWIPESDEKHRCFLAENCERAAASGLTFRPIAETVRDTLAWQRAGSPGFIQEGLVAHEHALTPEREEELLKEWHGRSPEVRNAEQ